VVRIVLVSGHYPPNFVSGGSLQPQRIARGLRARGHDVSVYAGWSEEHREPPETWDEVDETDMPVHWIVTTPWESWASDRNWDNPEVHEDFVRYLDRERPDVVHLHDLQMLGGSLVRAAAEAGAKTIVTMHDFWWVCARLFLVNKGMHPCSLVVDAGACACERNHRWVTNRRQRLAQELQHADLVLSPSRSAARVLAANGIAIDRLAVDENGLPEADIDGAPAEARPRDERSAGRPVRFVYAGGVHALKGVDVLLRAAATLAGLDGWELVAYGVPEKHLKGGIDLHGAPVRLADPFAPEDRNAVIADADVFVVPSIMRETHSIITREALSRGVPVLCTDTLGPEEVVTSGQNGLVVPAGDMELLADAMRSLVEDPALLERLREGCATPVTIRSLSEQVDGLDRWMRKLVAGDTIGVPSTARFTPEPRPIRRVVWACGITGAPLRYRARLAAEAIGLHGVESDVVYYRDPALLDLVEQADVLYVYRVPATHQFLDVIARAKQRDIPVVFDVDDLIFDPDIASEIPALQILPPAEAEGWLYGVRRYRTTMEHCDGFIGSTPQLIRHAQAVTGLPAAQFENGVGMLLGRLSDRVLAKRRQSGPLRIGYLSGTITHDRDWFYVEPAIIDTLHRHPDVELWLGGHLPDSSALEPFGDRVKRIPFRPWIELPSIVHQLDINLAPLEPNSRFNEAKSAIKWLEAALVATPTVASATEPFRDAIEHGVSGLLAESLDEWGAALDLLITDRRARRLMGERARREALLRWSPHLQGQRFLDVMREAQEWPALAAARPSNGWENAIADEPFEPSVLDRYTTSRFAGMAETTDLPRARASWLVTRGRRSIRERGPATTTALALSRGSRVVARSPRIAARKLRYGRPGELVRYTRRMLREEGATQTAARAVRFAGTRPLAVGRNAQHWPAIAQLLAVIGRFRHSIDKNGVGGTVDLAKPIARHAVMHSYSLIRLRAHIIVRRVFQRFRRDR
jgi:glycosyltransferase involved in cell wall biosynthesis